MVIIVSRDNKYLGTSWRFGTSPSSKKPTNLSAGDILATNSPTSGIPSWNLLTPGTRWCPSNAFTRCPSSCKLQALPGSCWISLWKLHWVIARQITMSQLLEWWAENGYGPGTPPKSEKVPLDSNVLHGVSTRSYIQALVVKRPWCDIYGLYWLVGSLVSFRSNPRCHPPRSYRSCWWRGKGRRTPKREKRRAPKNNLGLSLSLPLALSENGLRV